MFTAAMFIFFVHIYIYIFFFWKWASMLIELAKDAECRLVWFHANRNFLANEIYHFQGSPTNKFHFHLCSPLHIISSLFSHLCLFQNAILHKMLKLGFWNFKPFFLWMQFSLVATFSSLVLVICLSWYWHFDMFHEFLIFIIFNIWR